jgi:uncharacterized protein YfaS (alpha-2-macroglobulin family)
MLAATIALFGVTGCTSAPKAVLTPSPAAVVSSVSAAKQSASLLRANVTPLGLRTLEQLNAHLDQASTALTDYAAKVDDQSVKLVQSQEQAELWKAKQRKALKELWMWRGLAALTLASVAGYLALRMGWKAAL